MEYTPIGDVTGGEGPRRGPRQRLRKLESIIIDGQDADVVYRTAKAAYDKARSGGGPSLIECLTYRYSGHSRADPAKYRPGRRTGLLGAANATPSGSIASACCRPASLNPRCWKSRMS